MEENNKGPKQALNDRERFPLLEDFSLLHKLKQDELAPGFNFNSGDRLTQQHLEKVNAYASQIRRSTPTSWELQEPAWMDAFLQDCFRTVPFYKSRSGNLSQQESIRRDDLRIAPWSFVSSQANLNDLLVYQTSGTTGAALDVLFDPVSQACWIPQLQAILDSYGIEIGSADRHVAIALICSQESTLTYASLSTYLNGSGILKINLNPAEWQDPEHSVQYLEKYNPEILTGDPFAFSALLKLKPKISPKALVSSAMRLTAGVRKALEAYFEVPVLDIYGLTECRMIAVADGNRYRAIRPELYLEILDPKTDRSLPDGEIGELAITGGNNPFLPLIRYRTGDFCSLKHDNGLLFLENFEGRSPQTFYSAAGKLINTVDVSRALSVFALAGFKLHQYKDFSLRFEGWTDLPLEVKISALLHQIFGPTANLTISLNPVIHAHKTVSYSSDHDPL